jgi:hypothetical protein
VLLAELACGRAGDDGDVIAAQPIIPALRLMAGRAGCMTARCSRVTWRFALLYVSVAMLAPCVRAHALVGAGLLVRGGDLSCEAETCRARRRWVPLVGNWSEMQPTG